MPATQPGERTEALPAWLDPLPDAAGQRAIDAWAIEQRGADWLMELAGTGLARQAELLAPSGRIAVLCGAGNNGGDGLCAAVKLRAAGREVDVFTLTTELDGEPAVWLERLTGPPPRPLDAFTPDGVGLIVDALLGTGFSGTPRAPLDGVIERVRAGGVPVLACDVPSGVDASTGEVAGPAIQAAATATFHAAKPGLWIAPGKAHAGAVSVLDIAVGPGHPQTADAGLLTGRVLAGYPRRDTASTKFSSGVVTVIGGSPGLTGAPILAARGAQRAGAGYVTLAGPRREAAAFAHRPVEVMLRELPDTDAEGGLGLAAVDPALAAAARAGSVVLGPGLGRGASRQAFVTALLEQLAAPVVIDADGLNALAGRFEPVLAGRSGPAVLTPHTAELARVLDVTTEAVAERRLWHAREAATRSGAVVVLKGDDTLIATPDGRVAISPGDAPGLATAGTGDVLSGAIGALLARGLEPWHAACAGVWLHRQAGREAARADGPDGVIATDVVAALGAALGAGLA